MGTEKGAWLLRACAGMNLHRGYEAVALWAVPPMQTPTTVVTLAVLYLPYQDYVEPLATAVWSTDPRAFHPAYNAQKTVIDANRDFEPAAVPWHLVVARDFGYLIELAVRLQPMCQVSAGQSISLSLTGNGKLNYVHHTDALKQVTLLTETGLVSRHGLQWTLTHDNTLISTGPRAVNSPTEQPPVTLYM